MRCNFRIIITVLILLLYAAVSAKADEVDSYVETQMRNFHIPGISLAVVRNGQIVKAQGYGLAHVELNVPLTKDTVMEIGSMTKQFTATAVMMLVEEGKLSLDDKLSKYITDVPPAWSGVTIRHLLTHTSGINSQDINASRLGIREEQDILNAFYKQPVEFQPGESWVYCNKGFNLLGMVIERASGKSYGDFLAERILTPLEMKATSVSEPRLIIAKRADGYGWTNGELENRPSVPRGAFAGGGIVSTVGDVAKWDAALYTDKLLKRATMEQMWVPVKLPGGATTAFNYGFGWFTDTYHGHRVVHHIGVSPGFSSTIVRFVDDKLTVILMANCSGQIVDQFAGDIAAVYIPALAMPPARASDPDPKTSQMLKEALTGMIADKPNPSLFTPAMQLFMNTASGKEFGQWIASFGPLKSFAFAEQEEMGRERTLRYRIILGDNAFTFSFRIAEDGKIAHAFFW